MALPHSVDLVARNPVLSVRPPGWHTKSKIQVRFSGGIWSIGLRGFVNSTAGWTKELTSVGVWELRAILLISLILTTL